MQTTIRTAWTDGTGLMVLDWWTGLGD